jgi:phospholipid/cholesterol/gamma-HCH transport system substrate-binding protein
MVGGAILIALLVLVTGVLWLKEISITRRMVDYTVLFPNVGSLTVGDPVKVNGVKMGSVGSISLHEAKVRVVMKIDKTVALTDSCTVTVQNIGLMGERNVMVQLSEEGAAYLPDGKRGAEQAYMQGYFDTGIAEAMGMVGTVLRDVRTLIGNVQAILTNTVGDTSFVTFFRTIVARLDTVTMLVEDLVADNKGKIDESVANIQQATGDVRRLLEENRENINTLLANGSQLSDQAVRIATEIESLSVSLHGMVESVQRGEGTLGKLIEDEQFYDDLKQTVAKIDTLATDIQDRGLKLRVRLGFRDKRKARRER